MPMKNILILAIILALSVSAGQADTPNKTLLVDIELVSVKGGCFQMGEDSHGRYPEREPVHAVCVRDFSIGKYEVTQRLWVAVMGSNPSFFKHGDNYPVEHITFEEVQVFLNKLKELTGKSYRLPTEAEWEYAARGGGKRSRYAGTNNERDLQRYAWYQPNAGHKTHPVGEKMPNELGLHDMSGNVWEWVSDWYDSGYYRASPRNNPQGPEKGIQRVLRGGSWFSDKDYAHVSNRGRAGEVARYSGICGFRVVLPVH